MSYCRFAPDCDVYVYDDVDGGTPKQALVTGVWQFSVSEGWLDLSLQERNQE